MWYQDDIHMVSRWWENDVFPEFLCKMEPQGFQDEKNSRHVDIVSLGRLRAAVCVRKILKRVIWEGIKSRMNGGPWRVAPRVTWCYRSITINNVDRMAHMVACAMPHDRYNRRRARNALMMCRMIAPNK